ncbi:MAG: RNB domain-containing ribonuclease, partial [SAR324 cluster bacterium]|nr:RNB domain-containing ribonuclease [SAR324 cluster bacterium]
MNISEKNVYQVLFGSGEEGLTTREILLALNQRMKKKAQLRKALRLLTGKNICYKKDNHYFLKDLSGGVPAGIKLKAKPGRSAGKNRKLNRFPEGIFMRKQGTPVVFSHQDGKIYPVNPLEELSLLHGDRIRFSLQRGNNEKPIAQPSEILKRNITLLKGKLSGGTKGQTFFEPLNSSFPCRFKVINRPLGAVRAAVDVFMKISSYGDSSHMPEGRVDGSISGESAWVTTLEQILAENRIPLHFSKPVLDESHRFPPTVRLKKSDNRRDLRALPFITIDGDDAKDFDDAIYAETEGENFRLWISIADVAEYVEPKSELDLEARKRGTSTY